MGKDELICTGTNNFSIAASSDCFSRQFSMPSNCPRRSCSHIRLTSSLHSRWQPHRMNPCRTTILPGTGRHSCESDPNRCRNCRRRNIGHPLYSGAVHKVRTQKKGNSTPSPVAGSTFPDPPPPKYVRFCTPLPPPPPGKELIKSLHANALPLP